MAMLGHVALGLVAARAYHERTDVPLVPLAAVGILLAALPDTDLMVRAHFATEGTAFAHRGLTHSLAFAVVLGAVVGWLASRWGLPRLLTSMFAAATLASHGLVDMFSDTSLGSELFWPFSSARYLAPVRPVLCAPLGWAFFSRAGLTAVVREVVVFWPLFLYGLYPRPAAIRGERLPDS
jgi:inner membrane protein